ncbi:MAG: HAMP domain-containing histidine kinase [Pleurocapsa minor GSE-CHR-MK-17-07R]|nr:HAMP domain-containing histidine kinase [Pleurocapsa minor GSE-CHR-MK 17-07R]
MGTRRTNAISAGHIAVAPEPIPAQTGESMICVLASDDTPSAFTAFADSSVWTIIPHNRINSEACAESLRLADGVIAWDSLAARKWVARVSRKTPYTERPVVIGISGLPEAIPFGDFFVPDSPDMLIHTLTNALTMRAALMEAEARASSAQAELEAQQKNREFLHFGKPVMERAAHEVKTPLYQINAALQFLSTTIPPTRALDMAHQALERLTGVFDKIRMVQHGIEPNISMMRPGSPVEIAIRMLRSTLGDEDEVQRILLEEEDPLPIVLGDQEALGMALFELLSNALKYSRPLDGSRGGDVTLTISQTSTRRVTYTVQDCGIGIAPEHIKLIFEEYYQVHKHQAAEYGGTGVGLTLARLIVQKHGSDIKVFSTEGAGSRFSFNLPVVRK